MEYKVSDQLSHSKPALKGLTTGRRKVLYGGLSFFIPFILIYIVYYAAKITPFGDNTLFISDSRVLHLSYLSYYSRALCGKEDLLYSFQLGIGKNNYEFISGLLSPLNLLCLFFDQSKYAALYSFMLATDMSLSGLTMYLFLSNTIDRNGNALIFSTCYSLIGFNVAYCFMSDFVFFSVPLSLIAWGLINILKGKKPWLYIFALSYSILQSFYFGYMLCIASVALFVTWFIKDFKTYRPMGRSIIINYTLSSLISGLLPAFVWLPSLSALSGGRLDQSSASDFTFTFNMSPNEFLAKFFIGANNLDQLMKGLPNIFCGSLAVFLVIAFFADKRNTIREKLCYGALILFYSLTFFINALSMAVQGFSTTNWFNYRYSFVFSFIFLLIGYLEFIKLKDIQIKTLKITGLIYILMAIIVFLKKYEFVDTLSMFVSLVLLGVIIGFYLWFRKKPDSARKKLFTVMVLIICSFEMGLNYYISYKSIKQWGISNYQLKNLMEFKKTTTELIKDYDSSFYRIGNESCINYNSSNDPRLFDYYGMEYFGSCERNFVIKGLGKLGAPCSARQFWYPSGETAAYDSLLGAKYVVSNRDLTEEKNYQLQIETNTGDVYLNPYTLPFASVSAIGIMDVSLGDDPFSNLNSVWSSLSGINDDIFTPEENKSFEYFDIVDEEEKNTGESYYGFYITSADENGNASPVTDPDMTDYVECRFIAQKDGPVYSYNGYSVIKTDGKNNVPMKYIGYFSKGDEVIDKINMAENFENDEDYDLFCSEYLIAYADYDVLSAHSKALQDSSGTMEKITDSHLTGTVTADSDSRLFFTIPYDEGWTLKIDGNTSSFDRTADLFMSAPVSEGNHTYELTFVPKNLGAGIIISACAACGLLMYIVITYKKGEQVSNQKLM